MGEAKRRTERPRGRPQARRSRYQRRFPWIPVLLVTATVVLAALVLQSFGVFRPAPGQRLPDLGRTHLQEGQAFSGYNSTPPASGPHWPSPAQWGAYDTPVPDERAVHNLEHGGIVISYNQIDPADLQKLKDLRARQPRDRFGSVKIVIRPYDRIPAGTIAVAAWTFLDTMQGFDEQRIRAFIDAHMNRCCESVP